MIQRIQTVYLMIVAILMGVMLALPLSGFSAGGPDIRLMVYGLKGAYGYMAFYPFMGAMAGLGCLLAVVAIFLYRNRRLQIRLCMVELVMLVGVQTFAAIYIMRLRTVAGLIDETITYGVVSVFPLICIIFTLLAIRGIVKDESMVRSLDRIR